MSHRPQCPNHKVDLKQTGFPLPAKGQGVCPVSGASFTFEADSAEVGQEVRLDRDGKPIVSKSWKITGSD